MKIESVAQTEDLDLGDATLIGIFWRNELKDLALQVGLSSSAEVQDSPQKSVTHDLSRISEKSPKE